MPKPRRKKEDESTRVEVTAEFVHVPTPEMVVISDLAMVATAEVTGRFVKLSPMIPASQRDSFDGPALADGLRKRGALAVIQSPTYLNETKKAPEAIAKAVTDRGAVDAWFDAQTVADQVDVKAARELVHGFLDLEGM